MVRHPKIKVLVVEDSALFQALISKGLSADPNMEVVATARDPFEARDCILRHRPDVMTCDVEMPKMNGIEFIRRLLPQYPLPVIVVSTVSEAVLDAMRVGAVDFVSKPDISAPHTVETFILSLIHKIHIASKAKVVSAQVPELGSHMPSEALPPVRPDRGKVIALGASTGGTEAIYHLLRALPATMPGLVIVQHIPPVFSRMYAQRLDETTHFRVKEAETGDWVEPGAVLLAPGDRHMRLQAKGDRWQVVCAGGDKVNGHRPSVDVLFDSVAREAGRRAIGVLLTGMGYDGAKGLLAMKRKGARTIGQDEQSSVVYGMPKVACELGAVEKQASLSRMPQVLLSMLE